jgi:hypothetical protein
MKVLHHTAMAAAIRLGLFMLYRWDGDGRG